MAGYQFNKLFASRDEKRVWHHDEGADRYMFFSICWLSRQHGVYQSNNRQLAGKVFDWVV